MTILQDQAIKFVLNLPTEKLPSVIDYLQYLSDQPTPLDDYDYQLAREADEEMTGETISHEDLCKHLGIKV